MSNIKQAFQAALSAARNPVATPQVEKVSSYTEPTRAEKLASVKARNEEIIQRGNALVELGRRAFEKVSMKPIASNTWYSGGYSSRDILTKVANVPLYHSTQEGESTLGLAYQMGIYGPDDALSVFQKTASRYNTDPITLMEELELSVRRKAHAMREVAYMEKNSEDMTDDITKAKDAVQAVVKAKGELPDAVDIADAANVSPIAANIAIHETAELIAAVGGQVAASDIPDIPPEVMGPEEMGMGPDMGMMDPGMMDPGMMDPNMMGPPPMDPGMMDPNMMGGPPMDPGMDPGMMDPGMMDPGMMDPNMMGPPPMDPGMMEAQAGLSDDALRRMIHKVAEELTTGVPTIRDANTAQPPSKATQVEVIRDSNSAQPSSDLSDTGEETNPEILAGRGPDSSSDSSSPSADTLGDIKIHGKDHRSTRNEGTDIFSMSLEDPNANFLSSKVDAKDIQGTLEGRLKEASARSMINQLLKVSEEEAEGDEAVEEEHESTNDVSEEEINSYIKAQVREKSKAPSAAKLADKFGLTEEDAESYLEGIADVLGASDDLDEFEEAEEEYEEEFGEDEEVEEEPDEDDDFVIPEMDKESSYRLRQYLASRY